MQPETKLSKLRAHMEAGEWEKAIAIAARFPRLGAVRNAVLDAHMAVTNPRFVRQLKKDPAELIAAGKSALQAAYAG